MSSLGGPTLKKQKNKKQKKTYSDLCTIYIQIPTVIECYKKYELKVSNNSSTLKR